MPTAIASSHPLQSFLFKVRFSQLMVTKPWSWHDACYLIALHICLFLLTGIVQNKFFYSKTRFKKK